MKIPNRIQPLVDDGLIDDVLQRLKSGKDADVYTVRRRFNEKSAVRQSL